MSLRRRRLRPGTEVVVALPLPLVGYPYAHARRAIRGIDPAPRTSRFRDPTGRFSDSLAACDAWVASEPVPFPQGATASRVDSD